VSWASFHSLVKTLFIEPSACYRIGMFKRKEWLFTGKSGSEYTFSISPKSSELPASPGVLIMAYTHPRGHRAGWQVNVLGVVHCDNLQDEVSIVSDQDCIRETEWNCNYYLADLDDHSRSNLVQDLKLFYSPPCSF